MQRIIIANNRAYLSSNVTENKVFHKKQDMKNYVAKSASFKIYTGLVAKFLAFIGIASKFLYGSGATGRELKTIYLNKKSFVGYLARLEQAPKAPLAELFGEELGEEEMTYILETCPLTDPNISKVINHVNKHFNKIKKSCGSKGIEDFGVFIRQEIKNKIDSLNKATS